MATTQTASKTTVTAEMARWAAELRFTQLSKDAVYQAKRFLLDSLGCALGGYQQHDAEGLEHQEHGANRHARRSARAIELGEPGHREAPEQHDAD